MARTAVVAGTATTVSNRVSRRQANRWAAQDQGSPAYMASTAPPQEAAPPPPQYAAPAPPSGADRITQLKELAALKDQGVLSEEEFAAEKAKILAG
jgi:hypothetical protein